MGAGIAQRLKDAGYDVTGWNRTKAKAQPLLDTGMGWADTRALAAGSDVLFTMLTDNRALDAIASGEEGILDGLRPGTVWADPSTIARTRASRSSGPANAGRSSSTARCPG